jgi:hypothetical protein
MRISDRLDELLRSGRYAYDVSWGRGPRIEEYENISWRSTANS